MLGGISKYSYSGQLKGLILTYMQEHLAEHLGPGAVAKVLQRSSGVVGNGLGWLAKKVRQVTTSLAATRSRRDRATPTTSRLLALSSL